MRGFQLLELAIVLAVLGVLTLMTAWAFSGADLKNTRSRSEAEAVAAAEALRAFLLANKRLPCPDTSGDGRENYNSTTESCDSTAESGYLPYLSLGLAENAHNRMRYSVYRNPASNDITALAERTGDAEGAPDYRGYGDALAALARIPATPLNAHIRVAGVTATGASDCNIGAHPAFALVVPNQDMDGNGQAVDGRNASVAIASAGGCLASPRQAFAHNYDDFVLYESAATLMGWLAQHIH
jgi:type II secretory pathway pseudopilin PulG